MGISAGKLAPFAVILAFVGYCSWPSMSELASPTPPPPQPPKLPELAAPLYAPVMPPPLVKNPWGGKDAESLAALRNPAKPVATTAETSADAADGKSAKPPINLLAGLTLDATFIAGDERMAVINGTVYAAQEELPSSVGAAPQIKIANVLPYSVLLEHDGRTAELTYRDVVSSDSSEKAKLDGSKGASGKKKTSTVAKSGGSSRSKKSTK